MIFKTICFNNFEFSGIRELSTFKYIFTHKVYTGIHHNFLEKIATLFYSS